MKAWIRENRTLLLFLTVGVSLWYGALIASFEPAESLNRQFRFSMGAALAILILSLQSLFRLAFLGLGTLLHPICLWYQTLPEINPIVLISITILGLWASFELRQVAIRSWEIERYLSASLTHTPNSDLTLKPEQRKTRKTSKGKAGPEG